AIAELALCLPAQGTLRQNLLLQCTLRCANSSTTCPTPAWLAAGGQRGRRGKFETRWRLQGLRYPARGRTRLPSPPRQTSAFRCTHKTASNGPPETWDSIREPSLIVRWLHRSAAP